MRRDWLLAIAEGVGAIPGAKILLGPLIKLREEEKAAARNEEIDRMFANNLTLNQETLDAILSLHDQGNEVQALLQLALHALDSTFRQARNQPSVQLLEVSKFPLPITKGLLIQELHALWPNGQDEMRFCLRGNDYQDFEEQNTSKFIIRFVDSMPGNEGKKLAAVFSSLSLKRPNSKILAFAAEFLGNRETASASTGSPR